MVYRPIRITKRAKYGATRTTLDGVTFDSQREAHRWAELKLLEKAGHVRELRRQVAMLLHVRDVLIGEYRADFVYQTKRGTEWVTVIEDVKGFDTSLSRWKRKHVQAQYGVTVTIVK